MVHLFVCSVWKPKDRSPGRLKIRQEVTNYNLTDTQHEHLWWNNLVQERD